MAVISPAFCVALTGSDTAAGTVAAPFRTLGKGLSSAASSSTKTIYLRSGVHAQTSAWHPAAGVSLLAYPGDDVTISNTVSGSGATNVAGITIKGIKFTGSANDGGAVVLFVRCAGLKIWDVDVDISAYQQCLEIYYPGVGTRVQGLYLHGPTLGNNGAQGIFLLNVVVNDDLAYDDVIFSDIETVGGTFPVQIQYYNPANTNTPGIWSNWHTDRIKCTGFGNAGSSVGNIGVSIVGSYNPANHHNTFDSNIIVAGYAPSSGVECLLAGCSYTRNKITCGWGFALARCTNSLFDQNEINVTNDAFSHDGVGVNNGAGLGGGYYNGVDIEIRTNTVNDVSRNGAGTPSNLTAAGPLPSATGKQTYTPSTPYSGAIAMTYVAPHLWTSALPLDAYALQMADPLGQFIMDSENNSYSFSATSDDATLRFELRSGDHWSNDPMGIERCEIAGTTVYANGTPIRVTYGFLLEPGQPIVASFCVVGQLHQVDYPGETPYSPPVAICMVGNKMGVQINWVDATTKQHTKMIYTDTVDLIRDHPYAMSITANLVVAPALNGTPQGQLVVLRDGVSLVRYTGPLGIPDNDVAPADPTKNHNSMFWKEGIYRGASPVTVAAKYTGLTIVTGAGLLNSGSTPTPPASVVSCYNVYNAAGIVIENQIYKSDTTTERLLYNASPYYLKQHLWYGPYIDTSHPPLLTQDFQYNSSAKHIVDMTVFSDRISTVNYSPTSPWAVTSTNTTYTSGPNKGNVSISTYVAGVLHERYLQRADGTITDSYYATNGQTITYEINTAANGFKVKLDYQVYSPYQKTTYFSASNQIATADGVNNFVNGFAGGLNRIRAYLGMGRMNVSGFKAGTVSADKLEFPVGYVSSQAGLTITSVAGGTATLITVNAHTGDSIQLNGIALSAFSKASNLIFI